jgi:hypothetical protein
MMAKADRLYETSGLFDVVQPGDKVAIKLHVGELGNPNYIRPFFLKQIVDEVTAREGKSFLTDTCTYYPLQRNNAVDHMQTAVANGFGFAPLIVADGLTSENGITVESPDPLLSEVEVAGAIHFASSSLLSIDSPGLDRIDYQRLNSFYGLDCHEQVRKLAALNEPGSLKPEVTNV